MRTLEVDRMEDMGKDQRHGLEQDCGNSSVLAGSYHSLELSHWAENL